MRARTKVGDVVPRVIGNVNRVTTSVGKQSHVVNQMVKVGMKLTYFAPFMGAGNANIYAAKGTLNRARMLEVGEAHRGMLV